MTEYATLLRDNITLTCRSIDRIFLQAYVPKLQSVGQVCLFLHRQRGVPIPSSAVVVFVAEWADLTQLASAALVAMTGQPLSVAIGAIAALWLVTVLVSIAGSRLGSALTPTVLNRASTALMAGVGVFVVASAARSILAA